MSSLLYTIVEAYDWLSVICYRRC